MVTESAGAGAERPASTASEADGSEGSVDLVLPKTCPECETPFPAPRVQTLQEMGQAPVRRLRFECGACGHATSHPLA